MEEEMIQNNEKEVAAERLATASFVLGIISLVSVLCCCPFVISAIGIVLALLSKGAQQKLRPRAKTGLILSIVGMGISLILAVFTIVFPILMYKTNPEFRNNINDAMVKSLDQDEELFRKVYGDDFFDQMREIFENNTFLKEDGL